MASMSKIAYQIWCHGELMPATEITIPAPRDSRIYLSFHSAETAQKQFSGEETWIVEYPVSE